MRNVKISRFTLSGLLGLAALTGLLSTEPSAQPAPLVEVTLHTPSATVRLDKRFPVTVILRNTHPHRRVVLRGNPSFNEAGGIELVAVDARGQQLRLVSERSELTLEEVREGDRRVLLEPNTAFGTQRLVQASAWFPAPGRYELIAIYGSPEPSRNNRSVAAGNAEGATGRSAPMVIEVVE